MPARQKMTPVEVMIMLAILGILASITIPAMNQAQRRAQRSQHAAARRYAAPRATPTSDGQLNTIQVSELSQSAKRGGPSRWIGTLVGLAPIIISVAVVAIIFGRFRQQMTRRRAQ